MNSVPRLFIERVARLIDGEELQQVKGPFEHIVSTMYKDSFDLTLELVYDADYDTVDYRLCREAEGVIMSDRFDYRSVYNYTIKICAERPEDDFECTTVPRTDRALQRWLNAPFDYVNMEIEGDNYFDCSKVLELIRKEYTVDEVSADCIYNAHLDRIVEKSNNEKRLAYLEWPQFYENRTPSEIFEFDMRNERLTGLKWLRGCDGFMGGFAFATWLASPEKISKPIDIQGDNLHNVAVLSAYPFKLEPGCDCIDVSEDGRILSSVDPCVHFKLDHPTFKDKHCEVVLTFHSVQFERVATIKEALGQQFVSYKILFNQ